MLRGKLEILTGTLEGKTDGDYEDINVCPPNHPSVGLIQTEHGGVSRLCHWKLGDLSESCCFSGPQCREGVTALRMSQSY